jgi:superoxide reductase
MEVYFYRNQKTQEITVKEHPSQNKDDVELHANTTDASLEKHVPVFKSNVADKGVIEITVAVGAVPHPMTAEHHIAFICLVTNKRIAMHKLDPLGKPESTFILNQNEKAEKAYEFCNLHGLWVAAAPTK